jgi:long-chain acyl-CoA synthetase
LRFLGEGKYPDRGMTESTKDPIGFVSNSASLGEAFWRKAESMPDAPLYKYAIAPHATAARIWRQETYATTAPKISRLAHYLHSLGVGVGTRVAIISHTRPEWTIADMAIQTLGATTVSIYQSLLPQEAGFILYDSEIDIVFIENDEQAEKIAFLRSAPCPIPARENITQQDVLVNPRHIIAFEKISIDIGSHSFHSIIEDAGIPSKPPAVPQNLSRSSIASIVYTSGTTGPPKGVIQTHGNHLSNVEQAAKSGVFAMQGTLFLYLPLAHSFARLAYYIGFLTSASLVMPAVIDHRTSKVDLNSVARDIREAGATVIPSVPRLFEKMAAGIKARATGKKLQQRILRWTITNAQARYEATLHGQYPSLLQRILFQGLSSIRAKIKVGLFGAGFSHGIAGGAKLDPEVNRFFDALGITICEGYGLTESCVATHVNLPTKRRIGSVGPALEKVEVRINPEDGEILMRGPNIAQGYLNRPQATAETWDTEGWLHTGDVGRVDEDGFLYITDRKKELIVTAGGKKIPPQSIEARFKSLPFLSHTMVYGEGRPYCILLCTLNELELRSMLANEGLEATPEQKLTESPVVYEMVRAAVDKANSSLASYEQIKKFAILEEDLSIENGQLTPTLKMKRKVIAQKHAEIIERLYAE